MDIQVKIRQFPQNPGVYIMKNDTGKVIYVGKAKNLRKRVQSYFSGRVKEIKTQTLVNKIDKIDFIVVQNEIEALILEDNLIKKHQPRYNINLKDDKRYPYIKITTNTDDYPIIFSTRERNNDGDMYFGPYANPRYMKKTLRLLQRLFPFRKCNKKLKVRENGNPQLHLKPIGKYCLYYQLKQCLGSCQGKVSPEEYNKVIHQIILFLQGGNTELVAELKTMMEQYSKELKFEQAQMIKERLYAIEKIMEEQKIIAANFNSKDILFITAKENVYNITILFIRQGKMTGKDNFILTNQVSMQEKALNDFIKHFYINSNMIPEEIIIPFKIEDKQVLQQLLRKEKEIKVRIKFPRELLDKKLMHMAGENSKIELDNYFADKEYKNRKKGVQALKKYLNLTHEPRVIEGFDISNIQGNFAVGSMVRFKDGYPDKKEYRKFRIRTVKGIDDFKMMNEVVSRRYQRLVRENRELPDLVLVDGGKGQLQSAEKALKELSLSNLPLISLAKQEELIFRPGIKTPLKLMRTNPGLKLLQNIRDEAHRFAINYHKLLRKKDFIKK